MSHSLFPMCVYPGLYTEKKLNFLSNS